MFVKVKAGGNRGEIVAKGARGREGRKRDTGQSVKTRWRLYLRMNKHIAIP